MSSNRKRKSYSVQEKMQILKLKDRCSTSNRRFALQVGVNESVIRRWDQNRETLEAIEEKSTRRKRIRQSVGMNPKIESRVAEWVALRKAEGLPVTDKLIRSQAMKVREELLASLPDGLEKQSIFMFSGSSMWCYRFKGRQGLRQIKPRKSSAMPEDSDEQSNSGFSYEFAQVEPIPQKLLEFSNSVSLIIQESSSNENDDFFRIIQAFDQQSVDQSIVLIKQEPEEEFNSTVSNPTDDVNYCRCCFKQMSLAESKFAAEGEVLRMLQEITQLNLEPSPKALSFCTGCSNDIKAFDHFKRLVTLKQQRFTKVTNEGGDLRGIFDTKLGSDEQIRDEFFELSIVKEEYEFSNPASSSSIENIACDESDLQRASLVDNESPKQTRNKSIEYFACDETDAKLEEESIEEQISELDATEETSHKPNEDVSDDPIEHPEIHIPVTTTKPEELMTQGSSCPICKMKVVYLTSHLLRFHPISCKLCKFKTISQADLDRHMKCKHENLPSRQTMILERDKKNFQCDLCGYSSYFLTGILYHMKKTHLDSTASTIVSSATF